MGVQGFQEFLEKRCPGAVVPVDLLKLARTVSRQQQQQHLHRQLPPAALAPGAPRITRGSAPLPPPLPPAAFGPYSGGAGPTRHHHPAHHFHHHGQAPPGLHPPPPPPLPGARVLVDAGSALPRLYGGYQTDWVCGGQWNAMLGYLSALCQACAYPGGDGLELVVMFPGGLGKDRLAEWGRRCQAERQTAQLIVGHVGNKGTPPPRAWFLPPACLSHCVRLALIRFRVKLQPGCCQGPGMLKYQSKAWEKNQAMEYASEASGLLTQLKRQEAITLAGLFTSAFSKSELRSLQFIVDYWMVSVSQGEIC